MKVPETLPGTDIKGNLFASATSSRILKTASARQIAFGCWEITDTRNGIGPQLDHYGYRPDCPRFGTIRWSALPCYDHGPAAISVQDSAHSRTYRTLAARNYYEAEIAKVNAQYAKDVKSAPKRAAIDARAAKGTAEMVDLQQHPEISREDTPGVGWRAWHTHPGAYAACVTDRNKRLCEGYYSAWESLVALKRRWAWGEEQERSIAKSTNRTREIERILSYV